MKAEGQKGGPRNKSEDKIDGEIDVWITSKIVSRRRFVAVSSAQKLKDDNKI